MAHVLTLEGGAAGVTDLPPILRLRVVANLLASNEPELSQSLKSVRRAGSF